MQEARGPRRSQQQQPVRRAAQPGQLAGDHPGVRGHALVGDRLLDQFGVAERDRDRGAQLVGGVHEELALLLQQAQVLLGRSEEHTSELQSPYDLVCRLLLEKKKKKEKYKYKKKKKKKKK